MVRVLGGRIILLVAICTFRGSVGIVAGSMAFRAVLYVVTLVQREEIVVNALAIPSKTHWVMAFSTVRGKTCHLVVRALGGCVIILMAIDAIIAESGEPQVAFICMAFHATQVAMGAN